MKRPNHDYNNGSEYNGKKRHISNGVSSPKQTLPIHEGRKRLLEELRKHSTLIVISETASGKTTQIPQFILQDKLNLNLKIAITQPRRVAAISVAKYVAQETSVPVGQLVGYSVRFEDVTSKNTRLKYLTDGMLLREAISSPLLMDYSVIVLDEAHERTIHTDVLFAIVKSAQARREAENKTKLKIVVMSATMDVDHFSGYFNSAPVLYLEGRQYPVDVYYCKHTVEDYLLSTLQTVIQIHKKTPAVHDILVFLTGQDEIEAMKTVISDLCSGLAGCPQVKVLPLYAALASHHQMEVFKPLHDIRKIILSTNIAETSVTIPGVKFVVDSMKVKARSYKSSSGLDSLKVLPISKAQAWQRTGRAGRDQKGICYRVCQHSDFEKFNDNTVPEILRCNLASVVLQVMAIGIHDVLSLDFMDKPPEECLRAAISQLHLLGALDDLVPPALTSLGKLMACFPLEPGLARALIAAADFNCTEEVCTIIALLSGESIFMSNANKREQVQAAHSKFSASEGDMISLLKIYRLYRNSTQTQMWCYENFLNSRSLSYATEIRKQLVALCATHDIALRSCGQDVTPVRRALCRGMFLNTAELQPDRTYRTIGKRQTVSIHPTSVLFNARPAYIIYHEVVKTSKSYLRNVCVVDPAWLVDAQPKYFSKLRLGQ